MNYYLKVEKLKFKPVTSSESIQINERPWRHKKLKFADVDVIKCNLNNFSRIQIQDGLIQGS